MLVFIALSLAALSVATWRYVDFRITQNRLLSTEGFPNNCEGDQAQYCEAPVDTALVCLGDSERVCDMIRAAFEADGRFRLMRESGGVSIACWPRRSV